MAELFEDGKKAPSVSAFHQMAKRGDIANLFRSPGFVSSTSYARTILKERGMRVEVDFSPFNDLIDNDYIIRNESFRQKNTVLMKSEIAMSINPTMTYNCPENAEDLFHEFLKNFSILYRKLHSLVPDNLPNPYKSQADQSSKWFEANKQQLPGYLVNYIKTKTEFWRKNRQRALRPNASRELRNEWREIEDKMRGPLEPYLFHMRNLQEARTIADFLMVATDEEKARFNRFVACEGRPVL